MNKMRDDSRLTFPDEPNQHYWRNLGMWALIWLVLLLSVALGLLVVNVVIG